MVRGCLIESEASRALSLSCKVLLPSFDVYVVLSGGFHAVSYFPPLSYFGNLCTKHLCGEDRLRH